jgi:hypothetical protein
VWAGGSVCIIVGGVSYVVPISLSRMPRPEQNVAGSRAAMVTSAWRASTQAPGSAA